MLAGAVTALGVSGAILNAAFGIGGAVWADLALPILGEAVLAGAVVGLALRAILVARDRPAWIALTLGAAAWMLGDVYRLLAFSPHSPRPFPSPADAGYLLLYPFAYVGLWLLIRARAGGFQRSLWLDGLIGAAGVGAVGASLVIASVLRNTGGSFSAIATNVAYPLADVLLLAQLVAAVALSRWRPGRTWLFIGAGLGLFALADAAYVVEAAMGHTYVIAIGPLWIGAFVLIAVGAWQNDRALASGARLDGFRTLAVPMIFALLATGLLVYGQNRRLPLAGEALAVITLVLVMLRTALTFRENLALLDSRRASLTDELTGLANRRRLNERLSALTGATTTSPSFAGLLLVDLDGFKELNDTLGHHAGDMVLTAIGGRLDGIADLDLVARLGGDEFAVVVGGDPHLDVLRSAAEAVHGALEAPFDCEDLQVDVHASVGGALFLEHGGDPSELLRHADVAMYNAKEARTGYELYRSERDLNSRDRLRLVSELRSALREEQLTLVYQPKAATNTGQIGGVEALVRWQHPTQGLLTPDRFLDVAESAGLMRQLTSYVLTRALAQLAAWNRDGADLHIAVNLAMPNLLDVRLPDEVAGLLAATGVLPSRLTLEITENIVMADPARILDVVGRLHALGVGLSLDDFGAGSSSLRYLKRLTVDELKIDRSFVMTMDHDDDNAAIVHATIDLAHNLGLRVVAEGVETSASWERLQQLGCDEVQGYFLGRPVCAERITEQLREMPPLDLPAGQETVRGGRTSDALPRSVAAAAA